MQLPEPEKPSWFVLNSYTRNEHKVEDYLSQVENLQFFIPKRYALRNYYGRVKRELVPLIPGMVFVRDVYDKVQQLQKDVSFLGFATLSDGVRRMPMKVPDYQMDNFIRVVQHFEEDLTYFRPDELQLNKGSYVKIIGGKFDGAKGELLKIKGKRSKRLVVCIPQIMAVAATHIEPEFIRVISEEEFLKDEELKIE